MSDTLTVDEVEQKVRDAAERLGQDPDVEVGVRDNIIYWEGGPWDWTVRALGGERIVAEPMFEEPPDNVDAQSSFALVVY